MDASRKKALKIIAAFAFVFEIVYVIAANAFLRSETFDQLLNGSPEKLWIRFHDAYSYWPGHARMRALDVRGHNGPVIWQVHAENVSAQLSLIPLLWRTLEVNRADVERAATSIQLWQERLPPSPPSRRDPFRLKFHDVEIENLYEVAIHDYLYRGEASVDGSFELWPGRELNVWNAELDFRQGKVTKQDTPVLDNLRAKLDASLLDYLPPEDKGIEVLNHIKRASLEVSGDLSDPNFVNLYLQSIPWLGVSRLKGALKTKIEVRDGHLAPDTSGEVRADRIDFELGPYRSESWGFVRWSLPEDLFKMSVLLGDYKFPNKDRKQKPYMQGKKLRIDANTKGLKLTELFSRVRDLSVDLNIEKAKVTDLSVLNDFIPVTDKFVIKKGEATLNTRVYVSTREITKRGFLKLDARDVHSSFRGLDFKGDMLFSCEVQDSDEGIDSFEVTDAKLQIKRVNILKPKSSSERKIKNWAGTFVVPEALLQPNHSVIVNGDFGMEYDNAEPMLIMLGSEIRLIRVLKAFASVDKVSGSGNFKIGPQLFDLASVRVNSSDVDLLGRYRFLDKQHRYVAWFRFETFKAGIEYDGKKSHFSVTNALEWYRKRGEWPPIRSQKIKNLAPESP
ncbi:MAG TPA: hypothetical protein VM901_08495 [Bdellovibrionota bacterium]|nr:hypothetical protein [Bdellovibrionota bacterium]